MYFETQFTVAVDILPENFQMERTDLKCDIQKLREILSGNVYKFLPVQREISLAVGLQMCVIGWESVHNKVSFMAFD